MHLIHINASYKPAYIYGGPVLSVSKLCEGLVIAGADVEVLTTTANGETELAVATAKPLKIDGVKVTYFKRLTKDHTHFSPGLLRALSRKLKAAKVPKSKVEGQKQKTNSTTQQLNNSAIVHIHAWWNLVSVLACLMAKIRKVPVILSPRGMLSNYAFKNRNSTIKRLIHRFIGLPLLRYCHFHVTSRQEKEDILQQLQPKSITIIPNFLYLPPIKESTNQRINKSTNQQFNLLFLSRIEEKKGLELLFKALNQLNNSTDQQINFNLTIAGSGKPDYVQQLKTLSLNLNLDINWIGQQNQEEKWEVIRKHDLLILPSYNENFANIVIESLAMGTPVLISKYVGLADYVKENDFGWICHPDPNSVAKTLVEAIKDDEKRITIRSRAPIQIRKDFEEKELVAQYQLMYHKINQSSV